MFAGCTNVRQMRLENDAGWGFSCFHLRPPQIPLLPWARAGASILGVLRVVCFKLLSGRQFRAGVENN